MSSTSTNDTYGSALDYPDAYNGGGGGGGGGAWEAAGGEDGGNSKAVDDFKDGVEQLTEKRWVTIKLLHALERISATTQQQE